MSVIINIVVTFIFYYNYYYFVFSIISIIITTTTTIISILVTSMIIIVIRWLNLSEYRSKWIEKVHENLGGQPLKLTNPAPQAHYHRDHKYYQIKNSLPRPSKTLFREVLDGVGADRVGVKFPIFAVNCSRLPLSSRSIREKRKKKPKSEEKREKKG